MASVDHSVDCSLLHHAIQQIRKPLEYSAKQSFAYIDRIRDLEKTVSDWVARVRTLALTDQQRTRVAELESLFRHYDDKNTPEKAKIILTALDLLTQLETETTTPPSPESHRPTPPQSRKPAPESRGDSHTDLATPIQFVKGVGPKRARLLHKIGVRTVEQALLLLPRRYEDRRRIEKIVHLRPGDQPRTVYGVVKMSGVTISPKQKRKIFELVIGDDTGIFKAKWFNQAYLKKVFSPGLYVVLSGKITMTRYGGFEMIQPEYEILGQSAADENGELLHTGRIVPIYPLTEGLYQKDMRKIMKRIVDHYAPCVEESLPTAIQHKHGLFPLSEALRRIHFPENSDDVSLLNAEKSPAHQRLIFDEFFLLELGMGLKRHHVLTEEHGIAFQFQGRIEQHLRHSLGFPLTAAQNRVIEEIQQDMRSSRPMHRLLQGDVGSGKTLVALCALLAAIEAGYQGAIMVPTEILAEQHFRKIRAYVHHLNQQLMQESSRRIAQPPPSSQPDLYADPVPPAITTCLLTGGLKRKEREDRLLRIERGEIDLIVGTHALLQHDVTFHNLGLIVIDEQHKFGVMQRATLKAKGYNPDVLIMTATPIPRTLSLTVYGDLEVSILDELPPGRTPVITQRFYESNRQKAYRLIADEVQRGRQVYIVYPLVEESENLDLKAATEMSEHLAHDIFPQFRVGLVHGRLKPEDKDQQMLAFKQHTLDILVSTTVLEVGIDVPNATVMLIEHAERFGLSQLHQLRGRVGRGSSKSYCLLMTAFPMSEDARRRLDAMVETTDGFVIAERDLAIRGPGEFFGTKQSGLPDLHVANLIRDARLLEAAREEAFTIIRTDPSFALPEHAPIKNALEQRWQKSLDLISIG
ncbi:ATP-dependent DNA helicase RecG [candidate division KSB3 bacterium]|uniref:ATP-dependent DNA helicase RecG n=1 Tax=candidate division KSB3 bacterium TaxID=2044937 RepID=A0A9D5JVJ9_9BACT|nr:ATP-dependent DNA helicase RecG [candidate division KSB3 bacterium]MBD3325067.1 ATP-dependent DNA helicase RecG [candidate division KSB3 bacterium]